ncbi:unnamed protein product [Prorocentrum cordatum]|uniref:Uncharacterized protein n=1 Tax=Prorocentrum cordatum TaxID=2364126 RepID=A0ABN9YF28_9DINO|nr:unnamed protein product [Polarella glacialis]
MAEQGEAVDSQSRGPPFVTSFVTTMHWAAMQHNKEGVKQVPWMAPAHELYMASAVQVGELVPHRKWKNKTESKLKGRLIVAFDTQHLMQIVTVMLETAKAERRIGHTQRGPLKRDASKLMVEFK